jgi:peptide/nickel transport system permease protein
VSVPGLLEAPRRVRDDRKRAPGQMRLVVGLSIAGLTVVCAVFGGWLAPDDPYYQYVGSELVGPSAHHLLGTDEFGRDLLSRIIVGARTTALVIALGVPIGGTIGAMIGITAGYIGGIADAVLARVSDVMLAIPLVLIGVAVAAAYGPGLMSLIVPIGLINVGLFARVARGATVGLKKEDFMLVARSLGVPRWRVMVDHVVPNVLPTLVIQAGVSAAAAILIEAGLAYLGLGVAPPSPSWGGMLRAAQPYMRIHAMYAIGPGIAIVALVFAVNLLTDALRERLEPRSEMR